MPLEFLKFVAARPLPYGVTDAKQAQLARQCAAAGYLELSDPSATQANTGTGAVLLQVLAVLPEGHRAMALLDGFDKGSGFVGL